uniref:AB hydrolase-1 domain-containing protein n=1 Tax=Ananas comosus var. bracteatus TaxID=296719 RepID=A0A6V7QV01_ANACO
MLLHLHSRDLRTAVAAAAVAAASKPPWSGGGGGGGRRSSCRPFSARADPPFPRPLTASSPKTSAAAASPETAAVKVETKPPVCTADELHYAPVPGTEWRLALWRYTPSPEAPKRNHPLMLLSGVGTNAIGFDLSPGASFARHMASQGFDTWIVEVRGAGLSMRASESNKLGRSDSDATCKDSSNGVVERQSTLESVQAQNSDTLIVNGNKPETATWDEPQLVTKLTATFMRLAETLSGYLNEGQSRVISAKFFDRISKLLEDARLNQRLNEIAEKISGLLEARAQNSTVANQIRDLSQRLVKTIEEGQRTVSPQLFDLQERFSATIEDFQKQLDLIVTYDWDFDNYLEEDIPAAMDYISLQSKPKDGKLLAIGHSMGGILLYAMLSKCCFEGVNPRLAAIVTLASSVDYTTSNSSLKLLLPLADPAQALNVPVVPLGALLAAAHPLSSRPPFVLSWLNPQISAQDMMHPELFSKLVLNNFCTVPAKVLLQLTTAFREGGLCNRTATFYYKNHLQNCSVPVLALAGDQDLICPPEAVYETVKLLPQQMVTYKVFGKPDGPHYAHYDLVGGRLAVNEVYPCIIGFLSQHDRRQSQ